MTTKHRWYAALQYRIEGGEPRPPEKPEEDGGLQEFQAYLDYLEGHPKATMEEFRKKRARKAPVPVSPAPEAYDESQVDRAMEAEWSEGHIRRMKMWQRAYVVLSVLVSAVVLVFFFQVSIQLPPFGDPTNPDLNEVSQRYIEKGLEETGATNIVAGVILDYRAFDTFGESTVLFAATMSVILLLRRPRPVKDSPIPRDRILQMVGIVMIPAVMMYGIYVILNGHLSPGGGFSGGTVMGCGLILAYMVMGRSRLEHYLTPNRLTGITVGCLLTYGILKGYSFITGANHIGWEVPKGKPGAIFSSGFILPLNICVGLIVACTMYTFFSLFSERED